MPEIRYTERARRDLFDLWRYVADRNPAAAERVYARLEKRIRILEQFAEAGAARPDIAPEARMLVEPPYLILYRIVPDGAQIVRVLHGARRIDPALFNAGVN